MGLAPLHTARTDEQMTRIIQKGKTIMRRLVLSLAMVLSTAGAASAHATAEVHNHHGIALGVALAIVGFLAILVTARRA